MTEDQRDPSRSDQRLVDFLRLTRDWVWEADADLCLTLCSRRAIDIIGYLPEELLGRPLTDFGVFIDRHGNPKQVSMKGNFRDAHFLVTGKLGEHRRLALSAIAFFAPHTGAFHGVRGIARLLDTLKKGAPDDGIPDAPA